ncbi:MAG: hypothetical protein RLZZ369_2550 [Pseudomonadota bacterium]
MTEVAVVGVADTLKGQVAKAFVVTNGVAQLDSDEARHQLEADIMRTVDQQLGAVARPAQVLFVSALPKTRSGKLLRRVVQAVCEGRDAGNNCKRWSAPHTVDARTESGTMGPLIRT